MALARAQATPRHAEAFRPAGRQDHVRPLPQQVLALGLSYFPEYKPYVMEAEVERVRMESRADYIDPARKAAECFEKSCEQKREVPTAELGKSATQLWPPAATRTDAKLTVGSLV